MRWLLAVAARIRRAFGTGAGVALDAGGRDEGAAFGGGTVEGVGGVELEEHERV